MAANATATAVAAVAVMALSNWQRQHMAHMANSSWNVLTLVCVCVCVLARPKGCSYIMRAVAIKMSLSTETMRNAASTNCWMWLWLTSTSTETSTYAMHFLTFFCISCVYFFFAYLRHFAASWNINHTHCCPCTSQLLLLLLFAWDPAAKCQSYRTPCQTVNSLLLVCLLLLLPHGLHDLIKATTKPVTPSLLLPSITLSPPALSTAFVARKVFLLRTRLALSLTLTCGQRLPVSQIPVADESDESSKEA